MKKQMILVVMASLLVCSSSFAGVMPGPDNLTGYTAENGKSFFFEVTGSTLGSVWGTDAYTLDSSLAAAAVHAGALKDGQKGVVKVTILDGKPAYKGSTRNGVTTGNWGAYEGSYKVEKSSRKSSAGSVEQDPVTLTSYGKQLGEEMLFEVIGAAEGSVWGTDVYTLDSKLAVAAVHAGVLKVGEKGVVKVTILAGKSAYKGSARNGITTDNWGAYAGSYKVEKGNALDVNADGPTKGPANMTAFADKLGEEVEFEVTGSIQGSVWGTDIYTLDSTLAAAAVHAGALKVGETGKVKVTILAGKPSYKGSSRNGITTGDWGSYQGSYRVDKAQ